MVFLPDLQSDTTLYFLRHGLAGQHGDPKYKDDSLRPLTAQGKKKMYRAALGMQALGLTFDAIFSSPYLRAKQTAEIVSEVYKFNPSTSLRSNAKHQRSIKNKTIHFTENLIPPASIEELLHEVRARLPKSRNILFVGHEPHLTQMISQLLKSDTPLNIYLKKGGLCSLCITYPLGPDSAILNWLLTPAQLGLMAL